MIVERVGFDWPIERALSTRPFLDVKGRSDTLKAGHDAMVETSAAHRATAHACLQFNGELDHTARAGRAAELFRQEDRSSGLGLDRCDIARTGTTDLDAAGLHRLGYLALQVDEQQAVLEAGAPDLDMIG